MENSAIPEGRGPGQGHKNLMIWWEPRGSFPCVGVFLEIASLESTTAMNRPIRQLGDPVLKAVAQPIAHEAVGGAEVLALAADMFDTLSHAGGVGLAAPQVGESVRLILAGSFPTEKDPDRPDIPIGAMVNPVIVSSREDLEEGWEGCLSFLKFRVRVKRASAITVEYLTLDGKHARVEATGFYARVLQHEIDHLDGILTLDRAAGPADIEEIVPLDQDPQSAPAGEA